MLLPLAADFALQRGEMIQVNKMENDYAIICLYLVVVDGSFLAVVLVACEVLSPVAAAAFVTVSYSV